MASEGAIVGPKWLFGRLVEPTHDFFELLNKHAAKTLEGVRALSDWINEENCVERCQTVRDLEREADDIRLEIGKKLQESFVTPFDREDIYDLVQRMDEVINAAKGIAREIEAFEVQPSSAPGLKELVSVLLEGTQCIVLSVAALKHDLAQAQQHAMLARKAENRLTKSYRQAIKELLLEDDLKHIMRVKEVYKGLLNGGDRIDSVSKKLLHAIMKMG